MSDNSLEIEVLGEKVSMDSSRMLFDEQTIGNYMETEHGHIDHFGRKLADAEFERQNFELELEVLFAKKSSMYKDEGASDKLAENKAKADPEYEAIKRKIIEARHREKLISQHLRAWAAAHDNAQNRGHSLRKELSVIGASRGGAYSHELSEADKNLISDIVKQQKENE